MSAAQHLPDDGNSRRAMENQGVDWQVGSASSQRPQRRQPLTAQLLREVAHDEMLGTCPGAGITIDSEIPAPTRPASSRARGKGHAMVRTFQMAS
jgi:hypothetical protein